jgi:hypothetical protein
MREPETNSTLAFAPPAGQTMGICDRAMCEAGVMGEQTGPLSCGPLLSVETEEVDSVFSCKGFASCEEPAKLADHDLSLQEYLSVLCKQVMGEPSWWCSCALAEDTDTFELGGAEDGTDACTRASARCAERMTVPVALHGMPKEPPDPLREQP